MRIHLIFIMSVLSEVVIYSIVLVLWQVDLTVLGLWHEKFPKLKRKGVMNSSKLSSSRLVLFDSTVLRAAV